MNSPNINRKLIPMTPTLRLFTLFFLFSFSLSVMAQEQAVAPELLGSWSFSLEDPQTGAIYDGSCLIAPKGKVTTATITMEMGGIETSPLQPTEDGKYKTDMTIDGYLIDILFRLDGDKLIGNIITDQFTFPIEMKRKEEK